MLAGSSSLSSSALMSLANASDVRRDDSREESVASLNTPEDATVIVALIVDRWICFECLARTACLTTERVEHYLALMARVVRVRRASGDCHGCRVPTALVSIERPGATSPRIG